MKLIKKKKPVILKIWTIVAITMIFLAKLNTVFATGIGTAEVTQATDNIKRVITSIAMPLRWSFDFCKYSNCSN